MTTDTLQTNHTSEKQLFIKMVVSTWETQVARISKLLDTLTEEQLLADIAPGRNSGFYLIGHLAAANDGILPILGWGERLHPALEIPFIKNPDKSGLATATLTEIKEHWHNVNSKITELIKQMPIDDWFAPHTAVSAEDFAKEPHRNKLNIIINRTNHMSYHLGQLVYLVKKVISGVMTL